MGPPALSESRAAPCSSAGGCGPSASTVTGVTTHQHSQVMPGWLYWAHCTDGETEARQVKGLARDGLGRESGASSSSQAVSAGSLCSSRQATGPRTRAPKRRSGTWGSEGNRTLSTKWLAPSLSGDVKRQTAGGLSRSPSAASLPLTSV